MSQTPACSSSPAIRALATWISSGFGSGYARNAPGTAGSVVALLFLALLWWFEVVVTTGDLAALAVGTTVLGLCAVAVSIKDSLEQDPGWIVIDEWAGLYVALLGSSATSPMQVVLALVVFRLFDIVKPGPVAWAERLPGAPGIMADDLVAGALTAFVVQASWYLMGVAFA